MLITHFINHNSVMATVSWAISVYIILSSIYSTFNSCYISLYNRSSVSSMFSFIVYLKYLCLKRRCLGENLKVGGSNPTVLVDQQSGWSSKRVSKSAGKWQRDVRREVWVTQTHTDCLRGLTSSSSSPVHTLSFYMFMCAWCHAVDMNRLYMT